MKSKKTWIAVMIGLLLMVQVIPMASDLCGIVRRRGLSIKNIRGSDFDAYDG